MVASYNNRANKSKTITLGIGEFGYTYSGIDHNNGIEVGDNYGIYNKSSGYYWLASPDNFSHGVGVYGLVIGYGYGAFNDGEVNRSFNGIRPIVCIQTPIFDNKYKLADE